jgi:hypothetical protein
MAIWNCRTKHKTCICLQRIAGFLYMLVLKDQLNELIEELPWRSLLRAS